MCTFHYGIWYRSAPAGIRRLPTRTREERFWSKVDKSGECWIWTAGHFKAGYGSFSQGRSIPGLAHRASYEMAFGDIPEGMMVDHICHNRGCVRPEHLRLATNKQNMENPSGLRSDNTSGVHGVFWDKASNKWRGLVHHNGRSHNVGRFASKDDAAEAVRLKRLELYTHNELDKAN